MSLAHLIVALAGLNQLMHSSTPLTSISEWDNQRNATQLSFHATGTAGLQQKDGRPAASAAAAAAAATAATAV